MSKPTRKGKSRKRKSRRKSSADNSQFEFLFTAANYRWVLIGLGLIVLGMILMIGGEQSSPDVWEADRIYSARRIIIAPIFILAGLALQIYAIFKK